MIIDIDVEGKKQIENSIILHLLYIKEEIIKVFYHRMHAGMNIHSNFYYYLHMNLLVFED